MMPASRLRSSARIAGNTRLEVMSPTPITSQVSIRIFYAGQRPATKQPYRVETTRRE